MLLWYRVDAVRFFLPPACLLAFGVARCSPRVASRSERYPALLRSSALSSESSCSEGRRDNGDSDVLPVGACLRGAGDVALEDVADRRFGVPVS